MIAAAIVPPVLGFLVWASLPKDPERRTKAGNEATREFREVLLAGDSLEIVDAGNAFPPRAKSFDGSTLKRLADAANIVDVENVPPGVVFTTVDNAYLTFRILRHGQVLREYHYYYMDSLRDKSDFAKPNSPTRMQRLSPRFVAVMLGELTTTQLKLTP